MRPSGGLKASSIEAIDPLEGSDEATRRIWQRAGRDTASEGGRGCLVVGSQLAVLLCDIPGSVAMLP